MKKLLLLSAGIFAASFSFAQCVNADFESATFTGWSGSTGYHPTYPPGCCSTSVTLPNPGRSEIVTGTGNDTCNFFTEVAPGGTYSAHIGNNINGFEADRIRMQFGVSPSSYIYNYQYATVLEQPGHDSLHQPMIEVEAFDALGNSIAFAHYLVVSAQTVPGFSNGSCPSASGTVVYQPWTTISTDFSPYMGQTVDIQLTTYDCGYGGHWSYMYVDATCTGTGPSFIINPTSASCSTCPDGSATATLTGGGSPPYTYRWSTNPIQYTQTATGLTPGIYTVCATGTDGRDVCDIYVKIDVMTGVNSPAQNTSVSVCPNPMYETATVEVKGEMAGANPEFVLTDITGRIVVKERIINGKFTLNKRAMDNGIYIYEVRDEAQVIATGTLMIE